MASMAPFLVSIVGTTTKGSSSTAEQIEAADVMDKIYANHRVARIVIKFKG
jgi:hypothetical protein